MRRPGGERSRQRLRARTTDARGVLQHEGQPLGAGSAGSSGT